MTLANRAVKQAGFRQFQAATRSTATIRAHRVPSKRGNVTCGNCTNNGFILCKKVPFQSHIFVKKNAYRMQFGCLRRSDSFIAVELNNDLNGLLQVIQFVSDVVVRVKLNETYLVPSIDHHQKSHTSRPSVEPSPNPRASARVGRNLTRPLWLFLSK